MSVIDGHETACFLVIGGTRGTGLHFVDQLSRRKTKVSVVGRREVSVTGGECANVAFFIADLGDATGLEKTCHEIADSRGPVDHIVFFQRYRDQGNSWKGELDVSLTATRLIIEFFKNRFKREGQRSITIVGSVASDFVFPDQDVGYHVAKAGLKALTRYYAATLAEKGIRVNSVSPATILKDEATEYYRSHREVLEQKIRAIPLGRMGTPQDVANAILFLASPAAGFITGHDLVVDGGLSLIGHEFLASTACREDNAT